MLSFFRQVITLGSSAFSILQVLAVAIPLLAVTHVVTYFVGHELGRAAEQVRVAAAGRRDAEDWSKQIVKWVEEDAEFGQALEKLLTSNVKAGRKIDDTIAKTVDGAVCLSADFLRELGQLR